jgi:hypothetical protein
MAADGRLCDTLVVLSRTALDEMRWMRCAGGAMSDSRTDWAGLPTRHHQAADLLGAGLLATAWATDGTVEAAELGPGQHPFAVAVQWHPEAGDDLSLFVALAGAAARWLSRPERRNTAERRAGRLRRSRSLTSWLW